MPMTKKGKVIRKAMKKEYGTEKAKKVFWGAMEKETIKGVEKRPKKKK